MSIHFHSLPVRDIRKETQECVSIAFDVPTELKEVFKFMHGQNVTLKTTINGEEIRRSYSICSSPTEDELRVAVKKVEDGLFPALQMTY
jgi:ring-1,2-phenylacetyl-CoA epoxidase subunit PaaE